MAHGCIEVKTYINPTRNRELSDLQAGVGEGVFHGEGTQGRDTLDGPMVHLASYYHVGNGSVITNGIQGLSKAKELRNEVVGVTKQCDGTMG
ncbi:hypothetical protein N7457_008644 [Penicillium paradoxum]|uniref:uncharacterized protein n=1 Tax=Penicillium paradoxum TaxID=176176 RepID=UPI002548BA02|nr:uncharacterized protein N7457_008644 [Penicillium paradoxum]KAJ5773748.1 hypothetical protein N7457_008644 [Penicillium paradoxum]